MRRPRTLCACKIVEITDRNEKDEEFETDGNLRPVWPTKLRLRHHKYHLLATE